ncbi:MAG: hypothetical protein IPP32_12805 [Bacteroidetes bacterium]|nr:hypothetical protein [Bacteroidota bacterium]
MDKVKITFFGVGCKIAIGKFSTEQWVKFHKAAKSLLLLYPKQFSIVHILLNWLTENISGGLMTEGPSPIFCSNLFYCNLFL